MAAGLQVQPGLQTISAHACSHVNSHRITLAGLFLSHSATSDVGGHLVLCSLAFFGRRKLSGTSSEVLHLSP